MTGTVCSCGNWSGNHDPDCVVATTIHAIWTATFVDGKNWSPPEWNRAIEAILVDNAHRVATALGDGADLTALAEALADLDAVPPHFPNHRDDRRADVVRVARALVAPTGTETDDAP